jgi:hypothetical protein
LNVSLSPKVSLGRHPSKTGNPLEGHDYVLRAVCRQAPKNTKTYHAAVIAIDHLICVDITHHSEEEGIRHITAVSSSTKQHIKMTESESLEKGLFERLDSQAAHIFRREIGKPFNESE